MADTDNTDIYREVVFCLNGPENVISANNHCEENEKQRLVSSPDQVFM